MRACVVKLELSRDCTCVCVSASVRRQNTCCLNVQGWKGRERRGRRGVKKEDEEEGGEGGKKDKISPAFSSSAMSCLDCLPLAAALSPLSGPEGRSPITGKSAAANEVSLKQRVQSHGGRRGTAVGCQLTPQRTGKPSRQLQACQKKKKKMFTRVPDLCFLT